MVGTGDYVRFQMGVVVESVSSGGGVRCGGVLLYVKISCVGPICFELILFVFFLRGTGGSLPDVRASTALVLSRLCNALHECERE